MAAAITVSFAFMLLAAQVHAQQPATVGALLEKGGKKLSKEELLALFPGAKVVGPSTTNTELKSEAFFAKDGKLTGTLVMYVGRGPNIRYAGTWAVSDQGTVCADVKTPSGRIERCDFYFRLGEMYYTSQGESGNAALMERQFTR